MVLFSLRPPTFCKNLLRTLYCTMSIQICIINSVGTAWGKGLYSIEVSMLGWITVGCSHVYTPFCSPALRTKTYFFFLLPFGCKHQRTNFLIILFMNSRTINGKIAGTGLGFDWIYLFHLGCWTWEGLHLPVNLTPSGKLDYRECGMFWLIPPPALT